MSSPKSPTFLYREELPTVPPTHDHSSLAVYLALKGYPELGADNILNPATIQEYSWIVGQICRQAHLEFLRLESASSEEKLAKRAWIYQLLIEIALNTAGLEADWAKIPEKERVKALSFIREEVSSLEKEERSRVTEPVSAKYIVDHILGDMKKVMSSNPKTKSMLAWMAEKIEKKIDPAFPASSFLSEAVRELQANAYYKMSKLGLCRFGNDYALGLRWLRHMGFVQVSTNPVLAAEAYKDDPSLWDRFKDYLKKHPELVENIEKDPDALAMAATLIALWPNMEVLRPAAYLLDFQDGMVSYQLNPNVADDVEGSLRDAMRIYQLSQDYFRRYDAYLLWGWPSHLERGRPNIVFKVAGSSEASIEITRRLESLGIGTNNTVTFTVSQEVQLILAKIEGRTEAVKRGVRLTKVYETNMGGRLEAHLREAKAAELILEALRRLEQPEQALAELAKMLGVPGAEPGKTWRAPTGWGYSVEASSLEEKAYLAASQAYIKTLASEALADFLLKAGYYGKTLEEVMTYLKRCEEAISLAGTLVAQRVWWIFFSDENYPKWISYLVKNYGISPAQAEEVLCGIDVLPASKRKPSDTYLTLARRNMTNTEFPNHQLNVHLEYAEKGLRLEDYDWSITRKHSSAVLETLLTIEDFRKAYELTPELATILKEVGIYGVEEMGTSGLKPKEWASFGSRTKTMRGFTEAYNTFREECIRKAREIL
jgi:Fe2+ transport system protein FeoA